MIEYTATISGLDALQKAFEEAPGLVMNETKHATNRSLVAYQATARELAPIDKSPLRNSITIVPAREEGNVVTGAVGTDMHYAEVQEAGSGIYGPHKRPIRPKTGKVLVWKDKNGQKHFAKQVKGVRGKFYMKGSLERNEAHTNKQFAQAAENVAQAMTKGGHR